MSTIDQGFIYKCQPQKLKKGLVDNPRNRQTEIYHRIIK